MPKFLQIIFIFLFAGHASAQQIEKFEFWISSLDKASNSRVTYHATNDSLTIKDGPYDFIYFAKNYEKDKLVFKSALDKEAKIDFYNIGLLLKNESLKTIYSNLCIMDGLILHFNFEWFDKKKSTTISNIYIDKVKSVVAFINKNSPKKYRVYYDKKYLDKELKECDKNLILD